MHSYCLFIKIIMQTGKVYMQLKQGITFLAVTVRSLQSLTMLN